jgi:hypothetical protein
MFNLFINSKIMWRSIKMCTFMFSFDFINTKKKKLKKLEMYLLMGCIFTDHGDTH